MVRSLLFVGFLGAHFAAAAKTLQDLDYRVFPRRAENEAAILEWGNSAIISALDASVAMFGPQTAQAALLEVEAAPVMAVPRDGLSQKDKAALEAGEPLSLPALENEDEVVGNLVVMTNESELTGVQLAKIAQKSGAAALLVINLDEERPDDIHRLPATEGADEIDIPVVMISSNSATVLTKAAEESGISPADSNNGMPERVRLYSGGDRPFFEDVEAAKPTIYLIHNLLTHAECDSLVGQADKIVSAIPKESDPLQVTHNVDRYKYVERAMLWTGMLQGPQGKAVDERIEQVTGFPSAHYSDFIVDKLIKGSHVNAKYDAFDPSVPAASMTVFLTDSEAGGEIVYPQTEGDPVKVIPRKGMAVVHHNTDERNQFEMNSINAVLPYDGSGSYFLAHRYIFVVPVPTARRLLLPLLALPLGGRLPSFVLSLHRLMRENFGRDGEAYFDKVCMFVPLLIVLLLAQFLTEQIRMQFKDSEKKKSSSDCGAKRKVKKT